MESASLTFMILIVLPLMAVASGLILYSALDGKAAQRYFMSTYGTVDKMVDSSPIDKWTVLQLARDGKNPGTWKAMRYVCKHEPVPYPIAKEFLTRLQVRHPAHLAPQQPVRHQGT